MAAEPTVLAMILADDVHRDSATRKFSILGTYSDIAAPVFPWTHPALIVYFALSGGQGTMPVRLRLIDDDAETPIFETSSTVTFRVPLLSSKRLSFKPMSCFRKLAIIIYNCSSTRNLRANVACWCGVPTSTGS